MATGFTHEPFMASEHDEQLTGWPDTETAAPPKQRWHPGEQAKSTFLAVVNPGFQPLGTADSARAGRSVKSVHRRGRKQTWTLQDDDDRILRDSAVAAARRVLLSSNGATSGHHQPHQQTFYHLLHRENSPVEVAEADLLLTKFCQEAPRVQMNTWWSPGLAAIQGASFAKDSKKRVRRSGSPVQEPAGASLGVVRSCGAYGQTQHHLASSLRASHTSKMIARRVFFFAHKKGCGCMRSSVLPKHFRS